MNLEKISTIISSLVALLLLIIKLIVGIFSWSIAVLASAVDSLLDFFVSLFNYFAVKNAQKPADSMFNYGRWKIESLASFLEWLVISISWIYIVYESIKKFYLRETLDFVLPAILIMLVSIVITFVLVLFLNYVYKKTNNLVIEADSLHYKVDLYTNLWVLLALIFIQFTDFYFIDPIVWIIIWVYIIYSAFHIIKKWFLMIMDISLKEDIVNKIKKIILSEEDIASFHFLKTRKSWDVCFVQAHLVFKNPHISLLKAHSISDKIECKIVWLDLDVKWVIDFHLDPYDDKNLDKCNEKCSI